MRGRDMTMKIRMDVAQFKQQLNATLEEMRRATRPAAQEGAEIIYRTAKLYCPVFEPEPGQKAEHYFYGKNQRYGPYAPGNLRDAIYQAFSKDNSHADVSTYHISWNKDKAPYGWMVELGTSRAPAHEFLGRAIRDTRKEVMAAIKGRFIEELQK